MRLVSRGIPVDPVAVLPGRVRNGSRLTGLAPLDEIRIEEILMRELIVGIVVDVLRHVGVEHGERGRVGGIAGASAAGKFVVLNTG